MKRILLFSIFLFYFVFPALTWAQCSPMRTLQTKTIVLTGGVITVGADLPNGSIIYRGTISNQSDPGSIGVYTCSIPPVSTLHIQLFTRLITGALVETGIYATGLSGVGIRIYNNIAGADLTTPLSIGAETFLRDRVFPEGDCIALSNCIISIAQGFRFELIKIGNISGGTMMGVNLPRIATNIRSLTPTTLVIGNGVIVNLAFSGGLTIQPGTCTTPGDYSVQLGNYTVDELSATNETPWIVANINLSNCPVFTGMGNTSSNVYFGWNLPSTIGAYSNNIFKITLMPINAIRNGVDGTFLIDQSADSASGVDIQIRRGTVASNSPVVFNQSYDGVVPLGLSGNISIGFVARYIRNGDALRPGEIVGKVVFSIDYY